MRQNFPPRIEQGMVEVRRFWTLDLGPWALDFGLGRNGQPRLQVLLKSFLRLQAFGDRNYRALGKCMTQQRGQKWLRGWTDARARQCAALLQSPQQGLHSGSLRNLSEQVACRHN